MNAMFILSLSAFAGFLIGLALTKRVRERERYYCDTVRLCSELINNISYKGDRLKVIIDGSELSSAALKKNLTEYKRYIDGEELELSANCLTKAEVAEIKDFLMSLGRFDGETQIGELRRREEQFKDKHLSIKGKNEKQGAMYIKLGLLFGLLAGILLI